jgi:hypothetical protein
MTSNRKLKFEAGKNDKSIQTIARNSLQMGEWRWSSEEDIGKNARPNPKFGQINSNDVEKIGESQG